MSLPLDPPTLRAMRLHSQRIARSAATTSSVTISATTSATSATSAGVAETVRALLAVQAQDFAQAVWAVGLRTPGAVRADVLAALASGAVVRSAPIRGTLHFLAAEDLRWMLGLTAERTLASARTRFAELGLDADTFERAAQVAAVELAGGVALSREEFLAVLRAAGISTEGQRGYHLIFHLSHRALVCWGPPRGNQQALVLVDDWIPHTIELDRPAALREFAVRYFTGHGPATERDFAWWTKLTLADARAAIALARDALSEYTLDGHTFWGTDSTAAAGAETVHLLPGFDEYLLGYQDRSLVLDEDHVQQVIPGKNGIFQPIVVAAGSVIGTWRKVDAAGATSTSIYPFAPLTTRNTSALRRVEKRYLRFVTSPAKE
jgi:hypothetical protein